MIDILQYSRGGSLERSLSRVLLCQKGKCSMRTVKIHCVGVSPLLMDRMSDETADYLEKGGGRPLDIKDRPAEAKAREKIYRNTEGKIALPIEMLISALISAGRNIKNGNKNISTAKTTTLFELLMVKSVDLPLTNGKVDPKSVVNNCAESGDLPWVVDRRKGIGYNAKPPVPVIVIRPKFPHWEFDVEIEYNEKRVKGEIVRQLLENALSSQGLGAFRPNRRGPFGRSRVETWEEATVRN